MKLGRRIGAAVSSVLVAASAAVAGSAVPAAAAIAPATGVLVRHAIDVPVCPTVATPGRATCLAVRRVDVPAGTPHSYAYSVQPGAEVDATVAARAATSRSGFRALAGSRIYGPAGGYTPAALAAAYGYDPDRASRRMTVAVIDWNASPAVRQNLARFDSHYGIAPETAASFRVVNETGAVSPLPRGNVNASVEINLDVQAVRAVCHTCHILLVEANSGAPLDLATAVNTAVKMGADVVSNSYSAPEPRGYRFPPVFVRAYDHPGVVITASTGDEGWYGWEWANRDQTTDDSAGFPASSPNVVAVAGTTLNVGSLGRRLSETVWNSSGPHDEYPRRGAGQGASGGGCSIKFPAPTWQTSLSSYADAGCNGKRLTADVSAVGDPETGFDVYDSWGLGGWATVGGTSLSAPLVAGMFALAGGANGQAQPARALYENRRYRSQYVYDVTAGGNGWCGGDAPKTCAKVMRRRTAHTAQPTSNPNVFYGARVDCSFPLSGTRIRATADPECNAEPGYDGASGIGAPKSLNAFRPTTPVVSWRVSTPTVAHSPATFRSTVTDPVQRATVVNRTWNFGDGTTVSGAPATVQHTYRAAGTYRVTLTVLDSVGQRASSAHDVVVQRAG